MSELADQLEREVVNSNLAARLRVLANKAISEIRRLEKAMGELWEQFHARGRVVEQMREALKDAEDWTVPKWEVTVAHARGIRIRRQEAIAAADEMLR